MTIIRKKRNSQIDLQIIRLPGFCKYWVDSRRNQYIMYEQLIKKIIVTINGD